MLEKEMNHECSFKNIQFSLLSFILFLSIPLYAATPWLHTDGNKIKDPSGNVVVLRGVDTIDIGATEVWYGGMIELIDRITNKSDANGSSPGWYTKVIRLAIYPQNENAFSGGPWYFEEDHDDYYNNLLRPIVDYCKLKDIYVIVDWHYVGDNTYDRVTETSTFWEYMAPKFAEDSHVLFELFNEPLNNSGGSETANWLSLRSNMQTWINIIRETAPDNLILVSGPSWSQQIGPSATYPLTGDNIVMVAHLYPGHWLVYGQEYYKSQIEQALTRYPVFANEWGFWGTDEELLDGTITNYGQPIIDYYEGLKISHSAWAASYVWNPPMFNSNWTLRVGEDEMGGFVKDTLYLFRNNDQPRGPYGGEIWSIPGTIEAEDYDEGLAEITYHDSTSGNDGGEYRTDDVDIEVCSEDGYDVTAIEADEWLEYTVDVVSTGLYMIEARVASESSGGSFHIELDGEDLTGTISFDATGDDQTYTSVEVNEIITVGQHTMRLVMDSAGWNINWIKFTKIGGGSGNILREYWTGIAGTEVNNLTLNKKYPNKPTGSELLTKLEGPINFGDDYGTRIRGYLNPTASSDYNFAIAGSAGSELWLSADDEPENAVLIAYIANGDTDPCEWDKYASQQSEPVSLVTGGKYYIEILHKAGTGNDNIAVAWEGAGFSQGVIDGLYLSPYVPVLKCTVKAGKTAGAGLDSIICSGGFHATAEMYDDADNINVKIYSARDDYLVYEQTIDMESFTVSRNTYSYKHKISTGQTGGISSLKFDAGKKTFALQTKNLDLTGLGCPLYLMFEMGRYSGTGFAGEDIVNSKKLIPVKLMSGYADTLAVTKAGLKNSVNALSDQLKIQGTFTVADDSNVSDGLTITWGEQTFTIPGEQFELVKAGKWKVRNYQDTDALLTADFDSNKCAFTITVKYTDLADTTGTVDFDMAFGNYDETAEIQL